MRPEAAEGKAIVSVRSFSETHSFHSFMFALPASHIPLIQPALLTPPPSPFPPLPPSPFHHFMSEQLRGCGWVQAAGQGVRV